MNLQVLVLGCGDVGSAVAHRLFLQGADVVILDVQTPAHPRRGMAFTDAWFAGTATLEGVVVQLAPTASELPSTLVHLDAICGTWAPPAEVAAALCPDAVVDARMRKRAVPEDLRALAPMVVGLGPGFAPGQNCTVAIETAWSDHLGDVLRDQPASPLAGEPRTLGGAGRERFVYADDAGLWRTGARIDDRVAQKALVGTLGDMPVRAPLSGALRGLTHDGVIVRAGQKLVEVDPSAQADNHGLGARPSVIARGVACALGLPTGLDNAFFGFEGEFRDTLDCMPMSMRQKLDRCGLKLSLEQWRALPRPLREVLLETAAETLHAVARLSQLLRRRAQQLGWPELPQVRGEDATDTPHAIPHAVSTRCALTATAPLSLAQWSGMTTLQRYAIVKLAGHQSSRNWCAALEEFATTYV
jgi:xanthine dehydrogenase accessory factor